MHHLDRQSDKACKRIRVLGCELFLYRKLFIKGEIFMYVFYYAAMAEGFCKSCDWEILRNLKNINFLLSYNTL